jgi:hypothetical protein
MDPPALAARVQELIHGRFGDDLRAAAQALKVDEKKLRDIAEHGTDHPSLDALAAIVRRFGVDACWLLTGEYDWQSHRLQLMQEEEDEGDQGPKNALLRFVKSAEHLRAGQRTHQGGEVTVERTARVGSAFTVTLPNR